MAFDKFSAETILFEKLDQTRQIDVTHPELALKDADANVLLGLKRRDRD